MNSHAASQPWRVAAAHAAAIASEPAKEAGPFQGDFKGFLMIPTSPNAIELKLQNVATPNVPSSDGSVQ